MRNLFLLLTVTIGLQFQSRAVEGMWIPSLIEMFHSDMKTYGLNLSPEEIYATNSASLKDAIVQFNGGCTAEIVSDRGLILTNHHCGFGAIQSHSSLENDYLKHGFWAKNLKEELPNPSMRVTFVREIKDVTNLILNGDSHKLADRIKNLEEEYTTESVLAVVKPFNLGNQYYMLITEDFNDVRLVGTPPSAIGKFGGDTDNWVWPRHTGDFSVFRIYADKNNKSAAYSEDNVPYQPKKFLPISLKPKKEGDFTMVYGFPGSTDQHFSSGKLKFYMEEERPARIDMRQQTLDILKPAMNKDDQTRIQYASKQARIANAWKKWIGQIGGLNELNALEKKKEFEEKFRSIAAENTKTKEKYFDIIDQLNQLQEQNKKYEMARSIFVEYFYVGPEFMQFVLNFANIANNYDELKEKGELADEIERLTKRQQGFFKNYNKLIDQEIFNTLTPLYLSYTDNDLLPEGLAESWEKKGDRLFEKSILLNQDELPEFLANFKKGSAKKILNDPAYTYSLLIYRNFFSKISDAYQKFTKKEEELMKVYVGGILEMMPDRKTWADANSTLRIAYGKLEGSAPRDGMKYLPYTTIDGIMQKYDPKNPDFQLTNRFLELYAERDFGGYDQDGELWVCFTASNHTTGGNSGSPVIDADGNLMGINFDRSWESTMSDFMFDESRCRNIVVDIRYVLWVIDKYGEASHLIEEMNLIK
ncbi:S46 family peptidase [Crocinitomix algicola]|uniref:S46 family peptidase n=1 Tax=Crocinitomix algicola TaxID=1740263 RepID=UPI0008348D2C|nr:S46 family peptidase [Crocinitomix algicola]